LAGEATQDGARQDLRKQPSWQQQEWALEVCPIVERLIFSHRSRPHFLADGLLYLPYGQYLRVQVTDDKYKGRRLSADEKTEQEALASMDNPDAKYLSAYKRMGHRLGQEKSAEMEDWVRTYMFGM